MANNLFSRGQSAYTLPTYMNNNQESPKTQRKHGAKNSKAGAEILRYILVGIVNTFIGFGLISLFTFWGINYVLGNFLGYFLGMVCSFFLHRHYTFRSQQRNAKTLLLQFLSFIAGNGICYGPTCLRSLGWSSSLAYPPGVHKHSAVPNGEPGLLRQSARLCMSFLAFWLINLLYLRREQNKNKPKLFIISKITKKIDYQ